MSEHSYKRPYLDATVWTSGLDDQAEDHEPARLILEAADRGELKIVRSTMMELEVLGGPFTARDESAAQRALLSLKSSKHVAVAPTPWIVDQARKLRLEYNVDSMDAIHVATALYAHSDVFLTSDRALIDKVESRVGIEVRELYWPGNVPFNITGD